MVTGRPGHSVAELIVAITFLGAALGAVGASTLLGARWTGDAVTRQRAIELASATLDSIARDPALSLGTLTRDGLVAEWVAGDGAMLEVRVSDPASGRVLSTLRGRRIPPVPVFDPAGSR